MVRETKRGYHFLLVEGCQLRRRKLTKKKKKKNAFGWVRNKLLTSRFMNSRYLCKNSKNCLMEKEIFMILLSYKGIFFYTLWSCFLKRKREFKCFLEKKIVNWFGQTDIRQNNVIKIISFFTLVNIHLSHSRGGYCHLVIYLIFLVVTIF